MKNPSENSKQFLMSYQNTVFRVCDRASEYASYQLNIYK